MRSCLSRQTGWLVLHGPEIMSAAGMPCAYGHSRSMLKTRVLTICAVVAPISKGLVRSSLTGGRNRVVPLVTGYIDILGSEVVRTSGYSNWPSSSPVCVSLDNYQAKMDGLPCLQVSSMVSGRSGHGPFERVATNPDLLSCHLLQAPCRMCGTRVLRNI